MITKRTLAPLSAGLLSTLLAAQPAYAYLDPGTGSMILQALVGVIAAVSVGFAALRHRIGDFFRRVFRRGRDDGR